VDFSIEEKLWAHGYKLIAGVDEAGRGPLAGPVVAAAVILQNITQTFRSADVKDLIYEINDSKKLSPKKRELLFKEIREKAVGIGIGTANHKEIDKINILQATLLAMRRAIENLKKKPDYVIVDGKELPLFSNSPIPQTAIIRGDSKCPSIAAASIIAKVTRDRLMRELSSQYPQYKFEKHKGYPTKEHIRVLEELGPCKIHRWSFRPVKEL